MTRQTAGLILAAVTGSTYLGWAIPALLAALLPSPPAWADNTAAELRPAALAALIVFPAAMVMLHCPRIIWLPGYAIAVLGWLWRHGPDDRWRRRAERARGFVQRFRARLIVVPGGT